MQLPRSDQVVALYSHANGSDFGQAESALFQTYGLERLIPLLVESFPQVRYYQGRASILFWLTRYARDRQDVVNLAMSALEDRSYLVREAACSVLAYSLRPDAISYLAALEKSKDAKTRADAAAAVDAISHKNHHYYLDRGHTGNSFWGVNPGDIPAS